MSTLLHRLGLLTLNDHNKLSFVAEIIGNVEEAGYVITEVNDSKPWGAYIRIDNGQAKTFIEEFFPGLSLEEARLGIDGAELTPKFLIVAPQHRLSLQYHKRRAERWAFLTDGAYVKSASDEDMEPERATAGEVVQFQTGERHRLVGVPDKYVIVAEIWQHTNTDQLSDEDNIIRLADDYQR